MPIGFDADQDCSDVAEDAVAAGVEFVCRYYKNLTRQEARVLSDAGLKIVSIWETTQHRALQGGPAGTVDGTLARDAGAELGQPSGSAVVATVDFDATPDQTPAVIAYLRAFKEALGNQARLMVYANGAICTAALVEGIADYTWLAGGMGMRGSRAFAKSGKATIIQDVGDKQGLDLGIDIDSDVAAVAEYGGWSLPPVPVA